MEDETKWIKIKSVMTKWFYLQKNRTKELHDKVVSLRNAYICVHILIQKPSQETVQ